MQTSLGDLLIFVSAFAGILTAVAVSAIGVFVALYLRDKSRSQYDVVGGRAELSEMRQAYEERIKNLTLQLSATDQRWKDLNHLLLSSQRFEGGAFQGVGKSEFLSAMGIANDDLRVDPKLVLLLTPFSESFDESYKAVVEACRRVGLTCVRGDETEAHGDVLTHILRLMAKARIVIANIGSRNPNVYYELGIAHALGKPTLLISETISEIPFDVQSKRVLIYKSIGELENLLPEMLARALAMESERDSSKVLHSESQAVHRPLFLPREPADGVGAIRSPHEYLCITEDGTPIFVPGGPYMFFRLFPRYDVRKMRDFETRTIAQKHLRPMGGSQNATSWRIGRHEESAVVFFPRADNDRIASDAAELSLTRELWANDFYLLDPNRNRLKERGFSFISTGAMEDMFADTFENFVSIARDELGIEPPIEVRLGLVGVHNYQLAVPKEYFAYNDFAGRILRRSITEEYVFSDWPHDVFELLKPFFEKVYDAAGLSRPGMPNPARRRKS